MPPARSLASMMLGCLGAARPAAGQHRQQVIDGHPDTWLPRLPKPEITIAGAGALQRATLNMPEMSTPEFSTPMPGCRHCLAASVPTIDSRGLAGHPAPKRAMPEPPPPPVLKKSD